MITNSSWILSHHQSKSSQIFRCIIKFVTHFSSSFTTRKFYNFLLLIPLDLITLYNELLRIARNLLETRENIKIESRSFYHIICGWFSWGSSKNFFFFWKKIQNGRFFKVAVFQNHQFSKSLILKILLWKFHGLLLGLVGLKKCWRLLIRWVGGTKKGQKTCWRNT